MRRTSALILIGNEILSGRTRDDNIQFLALRLGELGIPLREIRVIPDVREIIIRTISELRPAYDEVFTTGGIGPTHDDITAPCVAEAFGVPWEIHQPTFAMLSDYFRHTDFNAARQRMAHLPRGAVPIANPISHAPGFTIGNVHVLAGVPRIMRAMFDELAPTLQRGTPVFSRTWHCTSLYEGTLAAELEAIQTRHPNLDIGSYPFHREDGYRGVALVAKGQDKDDVSRAAQEIHDLICAKGGTPIDGEPHR
ncbi:competence/damage-inducible protein A [Acetobacter peroxydans]|jgi:molybdenum cofactor synthesis domain-containing protein|uniref:competence/damage-inducible protein A n=1 Tax=Acetobacter peroxydans TaxID=104098 RepID=UPI0023521914|nr:molybdopterin-binding protein [Acetobacter peroxydans]MCH4142853.1 molybdopterin-binding protein [Acetobacter peroxydans]